MILMAPYVRIGGIKRSDADPSPSVFLYLLFGRLFTPRKRVDIRKILPGYVRIGGSQLARMVQDKEVNFQYAFRYLIDMIAQRNSKVAELSDIDVPVLILHGKDDRNVYSAVSQEFFKVLYAKNKEIKIFDCAHWFYDAILYNQAAEYSEDDRGKFVSSIVEWLDSVERKLET
jgi:alpha-beta hydrolase superfamily lysophospholipase